MFPLTVVKVYDRFMAIKSRVCFNEFIHSPFLNFLLFPSLIFSYTRVYDIMVNVDRDYSTVSRDY